MLLPLLVFLSTLLASSQADTGGQVCATNLCVNAIVDGQTVTYQLVSQLGFDQLGWTAIGFGSQMPGTPIVVTWPNDDGSITLSQREAPAHVMPTIVSNPAQKANLAWDNSMLATNSTAIAFTHPVPSSSLNAVPLIWAYSSQRPASSAADAPLVQHDNMGTFTIDLTQPMNALPTGTPVTTVVGTSTRVIAPTPTGTSTSSNGANSNPNIALSAAQRKIRTHGILMSVGFLVLLPLGVFIARFSRTIPFLKDKWFTAHWFVQFIVSGPIIFAGWALGYQFANASGIKFQDNHTRAGLALLILYLVQMVWGTIIHFFKPARKPLPPLATTTPDSDPEKRSASSHLRLPTEQSVASHAHSPAPSEAHTTTAGAHSTMGLTNRGRATATRTSATHTMLPAITGRPPQNYGHAILGLAIIALAFYNVHEGYDHEWPMVFGTPVSRVAFLRGLKAWWISWVIIIPSIYLIGLTLLPRQWKQETDARRTLPQQQSPNAQTPSE